MLKLRDYQQDAVNLIRHSYIRGAKSTLLVLPTGGGKTVVFSYIAATTASRGKRVLILVHRVELLRQTSAALAKSDVHHGLINPKYTPDLSAPVQVASVQTLIKRLDKIKPPDLIVIDEAHHALAGTWKKIIDHYPQARILGVTATPCRGDGTGLGVESGGVFDDLVLGPQVGELIQRGYLVKPIIYAPAERIDLSSVKVKMGDYDNHQLAEVMDKPKITGDAVAHYRKLCPGVPAVVFCVSVAHAQHVAEEFRAAGYRAYHADGSLEDDIRKRILNGLGNGTVDVVTSCDLISEGTDIPAIGCAILLRPTQSLGLYLQQVGRALRTVEGKEHAIILDHVGNVLTHGLPDEPREWTLQGDIKRKRGKKEQEKTVQVKQCEKCYAIHEPAPSCPVCGHVYVVKDMAPKQVDGELKQLTPEAMAMRKRQQVVEQAKAQTLEELLEIARKRGFKDGWARHIFNSRLKKQQQNEGNSTI
jgi:superfamily II DNA or RNA helicase